MTWSPARLRRHDPSAIDEHTMERLRSDSVASADAPPEYGGVARAIATLSRPATRGQGHANAGDNGDGTGNGNGHH